MSSSTTNARLDSLDAFRGLTIGAMILANNPGGPAYAPLKHAPWHGWTATDLIFPSFLLIVGVAIPFSLGKRAGQGSGEGQLIARILRRGLILFGLGLLLNGFPEYHLSSLRIPGVLQRIAVCYVMAALLTLWLGWRGILGLTSALLVGYWALLANTTSPGFPVGDLTREGSFASHVDRLLLAGHTYKKDYDPEGIISTIGALATTLIGVLAGKWLRHTAGPQTKGIGLIVAGAFCLGIGLNWDAAFPINKALWTSSFVTLAAGWGLIALGAMYLVMDVAGCKKWAFPLVVIGVNPITAYVLSGLVARIMGMIKVSGGAEGATTSLKGWLVQNVFAATGLPGEAWSLAYSLAYLSLFWAITWAMYRRNIIIKV